MSSSTTTPLFIGFGESMMRFSPYQGPSPDINLGNNIKLVKESVGGDEQNVMVKYYLFSTHGIHFQFFHLHITNLIRLLSLVLSFFILSISSFSG